MLMSRPPRGSISVPSNSGIPRRRGRRVILGHGEGPHLEPPARPRELQPVDRAELADPPPGRARLQGEVVRLVRLEPAPLEVDAPGLHAGARFVADLGERDPHLHRPPPVVDLHGGVPDRVPVRVFLGIAEQVPVRLRPRGADLELVAGQPVPVGIERELEGIEGTAFIPAGEARPDHARVALVHPRRHVDRRLVEHDPNLGRLGWFRALQRHALDEVGDDGGRLPRRVVQPAVDRERALSAHGVHGRRRHAAPEDGRRGSFGRREPLLLPVKPPPRPAYRKSREGDRRAARSMSESHISRNTSRRPVV